MRFFIKYITIPGIKVVLLALAAFLISVYGMNVSAEQKHILKKGENLSKLAKRYNVSVKELIRLNKIKNPGALRIGTPVIISESKKTPASGNGVSAKPAAKSIAAKNPSVTIVKYKVQKNDTIWTISKKFNASTKRLRELNKLSSSNVSYGRTLLVPSQPKAALKSISKPAAPLTANNAVTVIHGTSVGTSAQKENAAHFSETAGPAEKISRYVKGENVRVRKGPGIEFEEVDHLSFGNTVDVLEKDGNWVKIHTKSGVEGWCLGVFLSVAKPKRTEYEADVFASTPNEKVVKLAFSHLGIRYRWGGITSRGFDCSGFVLAMYRKIGVNLPHSAAAQFNIGKPVAKNQLKPGDRVFFTTYKRGASHVGIYIGGGKFIHASSSGGSVKISGLYENYYSKRYLGARR